MRMLSLAWFVTHSLVVSVLFDLSAQSWTRTQRYCSRRTFRVCGALHLSNLEELDDVEPESSESYTFHNSVNTRISPAFQQKYSQLINSTLSVHGLGLKKMEWFADRIEVTTSKLNPSTADDSSTEEDEFPNADMLEQAHKSLYAMLESTDASLVEDYELIVASPGIEDLLQTPRDFVTFQGFPVIVTLNQEFRKKLVFEGSLQERTDEHIIISIKGRILKIPRDLVDRVELPKPQFEPNDPEIRKLR